MKLTSHFDCNRNVDTLAPDEIVQIMEFNRLTKEEWAKLSKHEIKILLDNMFCENA